MGSWGHDIMAGDTPLDNLYYIEKICKDDLDDSLTKEELNNGMSQVLKECEKDEEFWQVLAFQIVTLGANMPQIVRDNIDEATDEDTRDWRKPEERKQHLDALRNAVHVYKDGNPINLKEDIGLITKILNDAEMQMSLQGKTEDKDGVKVVTEVTKIISCDIVQKEN